MNESRKTPKQLAIEIAKITEELWVNYNREISMDGSGEFTTIIFDEYLSHSEKTKSKMIAESGLSEHDVQRELSDLIYDESII